MLTAGRLPHARQITDNAFDRSAGRAFDAWVGDVFVSILPCWHIFERTAAYYLLSRGVTMVRDSVTDGGGFCGGGTA